jgi:hypothetical protein
MSEFNKYLKYKKKYLELKKLKGGGGLFEMQTYPDEKARVAQVHQAQKEAEAKNVKKAKEEAEKAAEKEAKKDSFLSRLSRLFSSK